MADKVIYDLSLITNDDIYLFKEGSHYNLYEKLGSHLIVQNNIQGVYFALWAPNASYVSVVGDFNNWNVDSHPLSNRWDSSGIFEGFIPNVKKGEVYKYYIISKHDNKQLYKSDPYAFYSAQHPSLVSIVWDFSYQWNDQEWMKNRKRHTSHDAPYSIYEVHLGSWKKKDNESLDYVKFGENLVKYVKEMGFNFVEFLPLMEHPFYGSWGYQLTGYFAPTSRYGPPENLMYLIDLLHRNDIGVILDWVPSHFPNDLHSLAHFDGTCLYEHADPRKGIHPDWNTLIFNYGRAEVKEFLISSALFWLDKYHIDGLRVDAVASMLYLDYSRRHGEWIPNELGGRENLEAIAFLKKLNTVVYQKYPDVQTFAEESTAWPAVTRPVDVGGLGFGIKWNMGWMHDVLNYFSLDPLYRKFHHDQLTFSLVYAFTENFLLPLSHDEVVHGKGSVYNRMPGDEWQKYANIRLLYGYFFCHPGKKLLFMGNEFAKHEEWSHESGLGWDSWSEYQKKINNWIKDLNHFYSFEPALYENDFNSEGFEWLDCFDRENSVLSFLRKDLRNNNIIAFFGNFTPVPHDNYRIGIPYKGTWKKILNSDEEKYLGSNYHHFSFLQTENIPSHGKNYSCLVNLPPLSAIIYKFEG